MGSHGSEPFAVSPTSDAMVYLRLVGAGSGQLEELDGTHFPGVPTELNTVPAKPGLQEMSGFSFTPDGHTVVYLIDQRQLVAQQIPKPGDPAKAPVVLYDLGHAGSEILTRPVVDPTGEKVLFSKVSTPNDSGLLVGERLALYEVPIAGGDPVTVLDERAQGVSDGPGVFLPSGKGILFVSDRMGLEVPAPVDGKPAMVPASNLFRLDPDTGKITAITPPTLEAYLGPPVVSPDGRWAAGSGVLLDLTKSGADLLLTDLKTGRIYRAVADPKGQPPTFDLDPAFSPDSRILYGTAASMLLKAITKVQSYQVALPEEDPTLAAGDRTLDPSSVTVLPGIEVAPVEQDAYVGCD